MFYCGGGREGAREGMVWYGRKDTRGSEVKQQTNNNVKITERREGWIGRRVRGRSWLAVEERLLSLFLSSLLSAFTPQAKGHESRSRVCKDAIEFKA